MTACVCFELITDPAKDRSCTHTLIGWAISHLSTLPIRLYERPINRNHFKAGEVKWLPEGTHLPENLGDESIESVLVELKT